MSNISSGIISGSISDAKQISGSVVDKSSVYGEVNTSFLQGERGERPQLRVENKILQYKYEDTEWMDLIDIGEVCREIIESEQSDDNQGI